MRRKAHGDPEAGFNAAGMECDERKRTAAILMNYRMITFPGFFRDLVPCFGKVFSHDEIKTVFLKEAAIL